MDVDNRISSEELRDLPDEGHYPGQKDTVLRGKRQEDPDNAKDALSDYGDPDYMSLSSAPAFNDVASPEASSLSDDKRDDTDKAQVKNAPRPSGQGSLKPG